MAWPAAVGKPNVPALLRLPQVHQARHLVGGPALRHQLGRSEVVDEVVSDFSGGDDRQGDARHGERSDGE